MIHRQLPEIWIKDAWLLRDNASQYLHELWSKKGEEHKPISNNDMARIVASYEKAWKPCEQKILRGMCDIFGLEFSHNIIDVYIAPWFAAFSDPLVIGVKFAPDRFVDVLTHELLHRLLTANTIVSIDKGDELGWNKLFGKDIDFNTLVHIPVHAGLQAIFCDVLKEPSRMERDKEQMHDFPAYKAAWEYVDKHGYETIIKDLKKNYAELAKKTSK